MKFEDVRLYVTGLIQACFSNKSTLDKLSESENNLLFNGKEIQSGSVGADGKSAYEVAVNNGYTGTEQEWIESLKGKQGEKGDRGDSGITTPINGFFTMYVDGDGNLWVLSETDMSNTFEYDEATGNLYFVQEVNE